MSESFVIFWASRRPSLEATWVSALDSSVRAWLDVEPIDQGARPWLGLLCWRSCRWRYRFRHKRNPFNGLHPLPKTIGL
ncbi:MAG TPA: hypothetical protein DEB46_06025 [Myxococcales bacterium]|nr:hypothetical protein [Myxococcales bacterium]